MSILTTKLTLMVIFCLLSAFFGLLPLMVKLYYGRKKVGQSHHGRVKCAISLVLCCVGGVLLATCFTHMLPDVTKAFHTLGLKGKIWNTSVPWAEITFCCGFFIIYLVEEVVHLFLDPHQADGASLDLHSAWSVRSCAATSARSSTRTNRVVPTKSMSLEEAKEDRSKSRIDAIDDCFITVEPYSTEACFSGMAEEKSSSGSLTTIKKPETVLQHHGDHTHEQNLLSATEGTSKPDTLSSFRQLMTVLALSLHAVFEGLAVGIQQNPSEVWYLFGGVAGHKFVLSLCIGTEMASSDVKVCLHVASVLVFAVISPIGICLGLLVSSNRSESVFLNVLQGVSGGTILYVVFFEVFEKERARHPSLGFFQLICVIVGFMIVCIIPALYKVDS